MFQSGLSLGDLLALDYGDVKKELKADMLPLMLHQYRGRTDVEHKTFFGADAVNHLKQYLKTRGDLTSSSPLFARLGSNDERATNGAIQNNFRKYAEKMPWIDEEDMEGWNPARPHSLRAAFRSKLTGKVDPMLIEFWMGHDIGPVQRAYLQMTDKEMRNLYSSFEKELSITTTSEKVKSGKQRDTELEVRYEQRINDLETTITTQASQLSQLADHNTNLKNEVNELRELFKAVLEDPERIKKTLQIMQQKE